MRRLKHNSKKLLALNPIKLHNLITLIIEFIELKVQIDFEFRNYSSKKKKIGK
jgi:hypothetical protein